MMGLEFQKGLYNDGGEEAKSMKKLVPKVLGILTFDVEGEEAEPKFKNPFLEHEKWGLKAKRTFDIIYGVVALENLCKLQNLNFIVKDCQNPSWIDCKLGFLTAEKNHFLKVLLIFDSYESLLNISIMHRNN
jgi:hypothetical protein